MIKVPIEIGDIVRVGRFKNKRVKVKTIDYDENGLPIINGRPLLTVRIEKLMKPKQEAVIKLKDILGQHDVTHTVAECVIVKSTINGDTILAKNRDRGYSAQIEIIHELVQGVEIAYLHDKLTDWSEGLNEFGVGIVNSSLTVSFDEKEGKLAKQNLDKGKAPKVSHDGFKIRTALCKTKLADAIRSVIYFVGKDNNDVGVKGHTIIANDNHAFTIEMTSKHLPVINRIQPHEIVVRTNHGIQYPDSGYTSGDKQASSLSRMNIAKQKLMQVKSPDNVLHTLSAQHTKDSFMNPYRTNNKYDMHTTSQVMYNLSKLELHIRCDTDHSEFEQYVNRLPQGYKPKIKVFVGPTT